MNEGVKKALCEWIQLSATDEELVNFAADIKARKQRESKIVGELAAYVGFNQFNGKEKVTPVAEKKSVETSAESAPVAPIPVSLVEPPGEASSKIGADTREKIRNHLNGGPDTLSGIATLIKRPSSATQSLLKLLWARKEIIFDGEKYKLRA